MTARSLGVLRVSRSPLIFAATLVLTIAATPASGSQPRIRPVRDAPETPSVP
jgi:hypothetical protein